MNTEAAVVSGIVSESYLEDIIGGVQNNVGKCDLMDEISVSARSRCETAVLTLMKERLPVWKVRPNHTLPHSTSGSDTR
jgi:hypothetical protein